MRVLFGFLFAALSLGAGSFDGLWRYAHPDAQFLCGVEWNSISGSEVAKTLQAELTGGKSSFHGLEFVKQLDRVLISSPGKQEWPGVNRPAAASLLMVIQGKFDWTVLRKKTTIKRYKTVEWLVPKDASEEMQIGVMNPETLLLGDRRSLTGAIDRGLDSNAANRGSLFDSAAGVSATDPLWFTVTSPATLTHAQGFAAKFANDIRQISGGVQFRDGLNLHVDLKTDQPRQAAKLLATIQAMMTLQLAAANGPGPASLLHQIKAAQTGASVQLALAMTTGEIQQMLKSVKGGLSSGAWMSAAANFNPSQTRSTLSPAHTKPPEKQVIKIVGLDSGPREIPFGN